MITWKEIADMKGHTIQVQYNPAKKHKSVKKRKITEKRISMTITGTLIHVGRNVCIETDRTGYTYRIPLQSVIMVTSMEVSQ